MSPPAQSLFARSPPSRLGGDDAHACSSPTHLLCVRMSDAKLTSSHVRCETRISGTIPASPSSHPRFRISAPSGTLRLCRLRISASRISASPGTLRPPRFRISASRISAFPGTLRSPRLRISASRISASPGTLPTSPLSHLRASGARPRLPVSACSSIPLDDRSDAYDPTLMRSLVSLLDYFICIVPSLLLAVLCRYVPHACPFFIMCLRSMRARHINVESRTPGPRQTFE